MTSRPISPVPSRRSGAMAEARHIDIRETDRIFHLLQGANAPWQSMRLQAAFATASIYPIRARLPVPVALPFASAHNQALGFAACALPALAAKPGCCGV